MKKQYADLINKLVICRWIDITTYKTEGLDEFIAKNEYTYQSYVFLTFGKLLGEDDFVIIISPCFSEENEVIRNRKADIFSIPKGCILKMEELDFKKDMNADSIPATDFPGKKKS